MIVYGYRQRLLGQFLADDVLVEYFLYLVRLGQVPKIFLYAVGFPVLGYDLVTELYAFIADIDARTRDEFFYYLLAFAAK